MFHQIFNNPQQVTLPSKTWSFHIVDYGGAESVVFSEMLPHVENCKVPVTSKLLSILPVPDGVCVSTFIWDKGISKAVTIEDINVTSVAHLSLALKEFDRLLLCPGGPEHLRFPCAQPECAYVDRRGLWRHNRCTLVKGHEDGCTACQNLPNTLRVHVAQMNGKRAKQFKVSFQPQSTKKEQA